MPTKRKRKAVVNQGVNNPVPKRKGGWPKGVSGNPKGRPKKGETLTDILREYGEKKATLNGKTMPLKKHLARTVYMAVILGYRITNGEKSTLNDAAWAKLVEWLYDRVDGKPTEKLQIGSPEVEVTSEDMDEAMKELAEWKKYRAEKS